MVRTLRIARWLTVTLKSENIKIFINIEQKPYRASSTCRWDVGGHAYRGVMSNVSITKLSTLLLYTLTLI